MIPSLRGGDALVALCARLLAPAPLPAEVVIADNGLSRETVLQLGSVGARVIEMGSNLGFGRAVNRAVSRAEGDVLVLLNDDAMPENGGDLLSALTAPLREGADMVAGVLLQGDRPHLVDTAGIEIDPALNSLDYLRGWPVSRLDGGVPPPVAPCAGAAAYRMDLFVNAGGFDEGYFAYWEDLDLGLRLRAAGARCALARNARAVHTGSGTLRENSLEKTRIVGFSRGYFLRKWGALSGPVTAARVVPVELAACAVLSGRHRSLAPLVVRVQGWRNCRTRAAWPAGVEPTVGLIDGARRRYARRTPPD